MFANPVFITPGRYVFLLLLSLFFFSSAVFFLVNKREVEGVANLTLVLL